jgi:hypothetical protein
MNRMASRLKKLEGVDTAHREVAIIVGSLRRKGEDGPTTSEKAFAIFLGGFPLPDLVKSQRETYDEFCARVDVFVERTKAMTAFPEGEAQIEKEQLQADISAANQIAAE